MNNDEEEATNDAKKLLKNFAYTDEEKEANVRNNFKQGIIENPKLTDLEKSDIVERSSRDINLDKDRSSPS